MKAPENKLTPQQQVALGASVIHQQGQALIALSENLTPSFGHALSLILSLSPYGRLITIGVGKAGYIAKKVSASFASIGIPSFSIEAGETAHGDFGRFTTSDMVLFFSHSGETPEIINILPFLTERAIASIAITKGEDSTLGRKCTHTIALGALTESLPLGIAPTTSTTAMLAVGDALLMGCMSERNITEDDFAIFHPGGNIGRSLLKVDQIMRTGDRHCIVPMDTPIKEAIHRYTLAPGRPGAATITDASGKLAGIFTDGNLRRLLDGGKSFLENPIAEYMTKSPKTISTGSLASQALRILTELDIDQIVVIDSQDYPIGLIDIQDLASLYQFQEA